LLEIKIFILKQDNLNHTTVYAFTTAEDDFTIADKLKHNAIFVFVYVQYITLVFENICNLQI